MSNPFTYPNFDDLAKLMEGMGNEIIVLRELLNTMIGVYRDKGVHELANAMEEVMAEAKRYREQDSPPKDTPRL